MIRSGILLVMLCAASSWCVAQEQAKPAPSPARRYRSTAGSTWPDVSDDQTRPRSNIFTAATIFSVAETLELSVGAIRCQSLLGKLGVFDAHRCGG